MEPAAIFLLLIVLAIIVLFVSRPFFEGRRMRVPKGSREMSALLAERERVLNALRELDFDQSLGKIPAEDYPAQRKELLGKGADVLRQLDAFSQESAKVEEGIILAGESPNKITRVLSDEDLEDLLSKRRTKRGDKTAGFCPKCGKPILQSDVFCPACGSTLKSN